MIAFFAVFMSTFAGSFIGLLMMALFFPPAILAYFFLFKGFFWVPLVLALPTTLLTLPLVHSFVPNRFFRTICSVIFGTVSGAVSVYAMMSGNLVRPAPGSMLELVALSGGFAGFVAGAVFDSVASEADR